MLSWANSQARVQLPHPANASFSTVPSSTPLSRHEGSIHFSSNSVTQAKLKNVLPSRTSHHHPLVQNKPHTSVCIIIHTLSTVTWQGQYPGCCPDCGITDMSYGRRGSLFFSKTFKAEQTPQPNSKIHSTFKLLRSDVCFGLGKTRATTEEEKRKKKNSCWNWPLSGRSLWEGVAWLLKPKSSKVQSCFTILQLLLSSLTRRRGLFIASTCQFITRYVLYDRGRPFVFGYFGFCTTALLNPQIVGNCSIFCAEFSLSV